MYLRFVTENRVKNSGVRKGIFAALYDLRRENVLSAADHAHANRLLDWFGDHLKTPARFNRTTSKGAYRRETKGIAWFKSSAGKHLEKIREIIELLERYDIFIETVKADRPGYIVYEDDAQIVAEPFRDTRT